VRPVEIGYFCAWHAPGRPAAAGDVGYVATGLKTVRECRVGDTITSPRQPATEPLPGYRKAKPMVFAGIYPVEGEDYSDLREALEKLQLNDASLQFDPKPLRRSTLASAAVSWACSTWRSSRSAWSASTTWILWSPRPRWNMKWCS
jgi:translation elongation factor EF-4